MWPQRACCCHLHLWNLHRKRSLATLPFLEHSQAIKHGCVYLQCRAVCNAARLCRGLPVIKENIKVPRHWPLCGELTGEFPAQRASSADNVSIWWRHHETAVHVQIACEYDAGCICPVHVIIHIRVTCIKQSYTYSHKWHQHTWWMHYIIKNFTRASIHLVIVYLVSKTLSLSWHPTSTFFFLQLLTQYTNKSLEWLGSTSCQQITQRK